MPTVTFVERNGKTHVVDAAIGDSLMHAAVSNDVSGILAECGGACACATCHVLIDPGYTERLPPKNTMEAAMLEFAFDVEDNSRLSCQLTVTDAFEGLVARIP